MAKLLQPLLSCRRFGLEERFPIHEGDVGFDFSAGGNYWSVPLVLSSTGVGLSSSCSALEAAIRPVVVVLCTCCSDLYAMRAALELEYAGA